MRLKDTKAVEVFINRNGEIALSQKCSEFECGFVALTLDQFRKIEDWVFKNREEIELAWNDGIEDCSPCHETIKPL